jgi:hypothetical protein
MQIKNKLLIPIIAIFTLLLAQSANAATITGTAYGEQIGFMHLDYTTAENPCDFSVDPPSCPVIPYNYDSYHFGLKDEFYISPADLNYVITGASNYVAGIQDLNVCNKTAHTCDLKGFLWSDTIGWTILDGSAIREKGLGNDPLKFPDSFYAKVNYDGVFSGYAWSEKAGWIKLSSDIFNPALAQNASNYGVWIDLGSAPVSPLKNDTGCAPLTELKCNAASICNWKETKCESKEIILGRPLQGYAWSEKLGWIKFSPTGTDDKFFGAFTTWLPDTTPPVLNIDGDNNPLTNGDNIWFINTLDTGNIPWLNLAYDPETGINMDESDITISPVANAANFTGCEGYGGAGIVPQLTPEGNQINLILPHLGLVGGSKYGFCAYTISGFVKNGAGLVSNITPKTFYIRAGEYMSSKSTFDANVTSAVADGYDFASYNFTPKDIASNPIVPVNPAILPDGSLDYDTDGKLKIEPTESKWIRDVQGIYHFDANDLHFNTVSSSPSNESGYLPVKLDDGGITAAGTIYSSASGNITYPQNPTSEVRRPGGLKNFYLQAASYAPTDSCGTKCNENEFILKGFDLKIKDTIPTLNRTENIDNVYTLSGTNPLDSSMAFSPAVTTSGGAMSSDSFVPDQKGSVTFNINNVSSHLASQTVGAVSIDNLMILSGTGSAAYELRDIYEKDSNSDGVVSRSDYMNPTLFDDKYIKTRYEIFKGVPSGDQDNASNTVFHTETDENYPFSYHYLYDFLPLPLGTDIDPIDSEGKYKIFESPGAGPESPPITATMDRSDFMNALPLDTPSSSATVNFTISDYLPESPATDITFSIDQLVAYRMQYDKLPKTGVPTSPFDDFAIYAYPDNILDASVKRVGVQATGIVTGENIYETMQGREFQTITSPGLANLKKQMRDNAAELTRNITACSTPTELPKLEENGSCVKTDTYNNTIVAVYGPQGDMLTLGNGSNIVVPKNVRYTLIVRGGADIFIKNNIVYDPTDTTGSFGIIVLADDKGIGGNVYIDPSVTNMVGLLYAEGSIMSSDDGVKLYYLNPATDSSKLNNQLYWQGSIVSKNTIGGAASKTKPEGVSCGTITDQSVCAQAYDLDYLRRFAPRTLKQEGTGTILGGYIPVDSLFSGGGYCKEDFSCTLGTLPTCITLNDDSYIDLTNSKSIDPLFIEKDNRPAPLGFTSGAGLERAIEIR